MTGFGRAESMFNGYSCKVEIRSVNNRYVEINARIPKSFSVLDNPVRSLIKKRCSRGSFDITIGLEKNNGDAGDQEIRPNLELAGQYVNALKAIKEEVGLAGEIDINSVLNLRDRDLIKVQPIEIDSDQQEEILNTVDKAVSELIKMREVEGKNLQDDLSHRIAEVKKLSAQILERQPQIIKEYKNRLNEKVKILSEGIELEESRLAQETALIADRSDISEEITRLESHLVQFQNLLSSEGPMGRKLEFICQEINRETNTIGSKTSDYQVSEWVIDVKSLLEKVREQLQNIE